MDEQERQRHEIQILCDRLDDVSSDGRISAVDFKAFLQEKDASTYDVYDLFRVLSIELFAKRCSTDIFESLLQINPECCRIHDENEGDGRTLMHVACISHSPIDIFHLLFELNPAAAATVNNVHQRELPLHWAIRYGAGVEIVKLLLRQHEYPVDASSCALELAMTKYPPATSEVIISLLDACPSVAQVPLFDRFYSQETSLPLHIACSRGGTILLEVIRRLIQVYPQALQIRDNNGNLPLHTVFFRCGRRGNRRTPDINVIKHLVEQDPDGIQAQAQQGRYPLHLACDGVCNDSCPVSVVKLLHEMEPFIVMKQDRGGRLPLHLACTGPNLESVPMLLDFYPDAAAVHDATGKIPLHFASEQGLSVEPVRKLLAAYPESISVVDHRQRRLPLHFASQGRVSIEVFELLLEMYVEGVKQTDQEGLLPLHVACQSRYDAAARGVIVRRLIELSPLSVLVKSFDNESPYQMCTVDDDTRQYILERQREAIQRHKDAVQEVFGSMPQRLPELPEVIVSKIWSFAKLDLWDPMSFEEVFVNESDDGDY